jgi:nicotinamidase/pyrazinamidase
MPTYEQIFIDVDTQHDFLDPRGSLYVPGGAELLPNLERLTAHAGRRGIPVVASACAHDEDDAEFARFPRHCVRDTWGQLKVAGTLLNRRITVPARLPVRDPAGLLAGHKQVIIEKTDLDVFTNPAAGALIDGVQAGRFVVYGVATDYCVNCWVEGLLKRGRAVTLVTDAIRGIDESASAELLETLRGRGVKLAKAAEVVGG